MATNDQSERADRILDAAMKLIAHYGYDKTTVSDIAEEAGVSKGAIYLHWKSKEDLFEALILREGERVTADLLARIDDDPEAGTIFSLFQHSIVAARNNPLLLALMTSDTRVMGSFITRWNRNGVIAEGNVIGLELVQQLQAARVIRSDLDPKVLSYIFALVRYGFLTIHEVIPLNQSPPLDGVGKMLAEIFERALTPENSDKEAGKQVMHLILDSMREFLRKERKEI